MHTTYNVWATNSWAVSTSSLSRKSGSGSPLEDQSQEIIPNSVRGTTALVRTTLSVCCLRQEIHALVACTGLEINVSSPEIRKGMGNWRRDGCGSHAEKWQIRPKWPSHLAPPRMKVGSNRFCLTTVIDSCPRVFVDHYSCGLLPGLSPSPYSFIPICPSILLTEVCLFVPTNTHCTMAAHLRRPFSSWGDKVGSVGEWK